MIVYCNIFAAVVIKILNKMKNIENKLKHISKLSIFLHVMQFNNSIGPMLSFQFSYLSKLEKLIF